MRTLTSLAGNTQKLDGGAMFGNAPRALWSRWLPPDDQHRVPLACRCLLVRESDGRRILLEAGIGAFFAPEMKSRYGVVEAGHVLLESLAAAGCSDADIDVVILSHLHFDHAGGLLAAWDGGPMRLLFPNARFVVGRKQWERARKPHPRDRASYIPELLDLLEASGRLTLTDGDTPDCLPADYRFHLSDGHTPGLLMTELPLAEGPVVYVADLIPGAPWVHVPITMGYDRYPELLTEEKAALLGDLAARHGRLFFTHDPELALARVARDDKGRFHAVAGLARITALAS
ncbi:MBL fold metallo-hydrolase [uncultured Aquitalea sp.]|uniref:MBL fold metallo-hydrolase n=1 Tax=uncultured Aquitalea sp. TaxID=540272 RepID=UPI0025E86A12|nr:MBL fold metallo-hydrolase [uncultured Aquitalea sp.]